MGIRAQQQYVQTIEEALEVLRSPAGALPKLYVSGTIDQALQALRRELVAEARGEGCTWEQIGTELGMSKQAAQQRYGSE